MKKLVLTVLLMLPVLSLGFSRSSQKTDLNTLLSAPEVVEIGGQKLKMETYLWRDFMPMSPPDGKPLKASVAILPLDGKPIAANLDAVRIWVIKDKEIWQEQLQGVGRNLPAMGQLRFEKMADNGPKWETGIAVTVVVELRDQSGQKWLLKAADQKINRTE